MTMEGIPVLTEEEKALRRELEDHFLATPEVVFVGVAGTPQDPNGKLVITLGTERPKVVADLLAASLPPVQSKLEGRSYRITIVRGRARTER